MGSKKDHIPWNKGKKIGPRSEETKRKISESMKGKNNPNYGKPAWSRGKKFSEEHKEKISRSCMGRIPWNKGKSLSEEHKRKIGLGNKGKTISKKQRLEISNALKGNIPTDEAKRNLSNALKKWAQTPRGKEHYKKMIRLAHTPQASKKRSLSLKRAFKEGRHPLLSPENRIRTFRACGKNNAGGTAIEKRINKLLNTMALEKETQKPILCGVNSLGYPKYLFPDFFLPSYNLIIECDGEYWHQDKEREKQRDAILHRQGYRILHLKGKEIREDLEGCRTRIENLINN